MVYLHLLDFYGFHVGKYTIQHGSYGIGSGPQDSCNCHCQDDLLRV